MVANGGKISEIAPKLGHAGEALQNCLKLLYYQFIWGKFTGSLKEADVLGVEPFLHGPV